jgi:hypothetical protein
MPQRSEIAPEELEDYDWVVNRIENPNPYNRHVQDVWPKTIPALRSFWYTMLVSPPISANCGKLARAVNKFVPGSERKGGWWKPIDHELFDVVLGFEEPQRPNTFHAIQYMAEGGRVEALEALYHGREQDLTEEERNVVTFHRHIIHGTMTDESWDWMEKRVGSERGLVEFVFLINYIMMCHRLTQAINSWKLVPGVHTREDFGEMLQAYRAGKIKLPPPIYDTRIPEAPKGSKPQAATDWSAAPTGLANQASASR